MKLYKLNWLIYEIFCSILKAFIFGFFILKSWQNNYWCNLSSIILLLNNLIIFIRITKQFLNFLSCLKTSHYWHLQIHENEGKRPLRALTRFIKSFLKHIDCNFSILCFFYIYIEMLFYKQLQWQDVEIYIINNQNTSLAFASLTNISLGFQYLILIYLLIYMNIDVLLIWL